MQAEMRKLWTDHVVWTRNYIISAIANLGDVPAVTERLLHNQDEIGAAIGPYYGWQAAHQLSQLLREHIMIAGQLVTAAKVGDRNAATRIEHDWYRNADQIAAFLARANPYWKEKSMQAMLYQHLTLTKAEAMLRLQQRWVEDVVNYDNIYAQALKMADMLSAGICRQFPQH
jgi:hypothetical protein